jgi:hypothetical protein
MGAGTGKQRIPDFFEKKAVFLLTFFENLKKI